MSPKLRPLPRASGALLKVGPLAVPAPPHRRLVEDLQIRDAFYEFVEGVRGDFRVLRKMNVGGRGASRRFAKIAMGCASTLEELWVWDNGEFVERVRFDFKVLRKVDVRGDSACRRFAKIAMGCASTLEELWVWDNGEFVEGVRFDFKVLRKVDAWGKGASKWCAEIATRCASPLAYLRIRGDC
eukprot:GHVU01228158.1.p1 GENE.GHVU01228158.1~~GHVU01228158.1.p1  ORF type:complete len:184 (+),score=29.07 GHVU01228158.1:762-1313(+)